MTSRMPSILVSGLMALSAGCSPKNCCSPPVPASVTVSPGAATLTVGDTVQLVATVKDASGNVLANRSVTWTSSDPAIATVSATGLVTGVGVNPLTATIRATSENVTGYASILVRLIPVASVLVAPTADTVLVGHTVQLVATMRDSADHVLTDRAVAWASSNPSVATVSTTGLVTGVAASALPTTITATSEGVQGSAAIAVTGTAPADTGDFASVDAGTYHSCGRTPAGAAYCWGYNAYGGLGDGSTTDAATPQAVSGGLTFTTVSVGGIDACGLTSSGDAYCWGGDPYGELGAGAPGPQTCSIYAIPCSTLPLPVAGGLHFLSLSAAWGLTCAQTADGSTYCWGSNEFGQLGVGSDTTSLARCAYGGPCSHVPAPITGGRTFVQYGVGSTYGCGLTASGDVYCWGDNRTGTLGIGTDGGPDLCGVTPCSRAPLRVTGGHTFTTLRVGYFHTCALATDGVWYCWGSNNYGQLGNGMTGPELCQGTYPCSTNPVAATTAASLAMLFPGGWHQNCGLTSGGTAYCWGDNADGQLGDSTTTNSLTPVAVAGGLTFIGLSPYYHHSCGLANSGIAYCWGDNFGGQLGDGTTTDSPVPVRVGRPGAAAAISTTPRVRAQQPPIAAFEARP